MKHLFAVTILSIYSAVILQNASAQVDIVASVYDIRIQTSSTANLNPDIAFIVHAPPLIKGTRLIVKYPSADRSTVRSKFPIGTLFSMSFSYKFYENLLDEAKTLESIQKQLDRGVSPQHVSQGVGLPDIAIAELSKLIEITQMPKAAEQGAAANP